MVYGCEDCRDGEVFPPEECPTCRGNKRKRQPTHMEKQAQKAFQQEVFQKLQSEKWVKAVLDARRMLGLPADGLDQEDAVNYIETQLQLYASLYMLTDPLNSPFPEALKEMLTSQDLTQEQKERVRKTLEEAPLGDPGVVDRMGPGLTLLLRLNLAAARLADWLGVQGHLPVLRYVLSPKTWPLDGWKPEPSSKPGPLWNAFVSQLSALGLPTVGAEVRQSERVSLKDLFLARYAAVLRESGARWDDIRSNWNRLCPFWSYDDWRAFRKASSDAKKRVSGKVS